MLCYHPNDRDEIRRAYLQKGPCQPKEHNFPQRQFGSSLRKFNPDWFLEFGNWLEYSVSKDAVFCLCCYLMRYEIGENKGWDAFVTEGFSNWKKKERLNIHVGGPNSAHNHAWRKCNALMNQKQHIEVAINKQSDLIKREYRIHLTATVDCIRLILKLGIAFRGDDESVNSKRKGNFLEILHFLTSHNEEIDKVLRQCRGNLKLVAPDIQKDIVKAAARETSKAIICDINGDLFSILIDESRDSSVKEQMSLVLRYVDKKGHVIERFFGVVHVANTSAISLKLSLESLFAKYNLSLSRVRGQGYDGASNMQGEFNGLKSLILKEHKCAFYVHCFAHQLQLALVAVAKKDDDIAWFFIQINNLSNIVGASCKRRDIFRESQSLNVNEGLESGEISSGRGLNQESTLTRAGDTRWGSHYGTLLRLVSLFPSVCDVLDTIVKEGSKAEQRVEAHLLKNTLQSFEFIFKLLLMRNILGITNDLSQALQRKDQDIVNAMTFVKVSKARLQNMREDGWCNLLAEVTLFCKKKDIEIVNMDDVFTLHGKPKRNVETVSNLHHFQVEVFYKVIDRQLQELNNRFTEVNSELLICVASLNPQDSFFAFDKEKLINMARFYPSEFSSVELIGLDNQLENYIMDVRSSEQFSNLHGISDLSGMMVETKKHIAYPMVYLLLKLALLLPVATATVERSFSAMNFVKNQLRNRMGDDFLNNCLVTYIESEVFDSVENENIMQYFQNMQSRRGQL
ncbi:zinc finger MYM-type protein 1-like [Trifolium pratense]|uniref:Zinc finger MYM-type protein 1-like n=1 Tax=Trifolium pratense TaxID=57577 RepID=A0A2K3L0Q0_TRIPR|nr:zinc finger MYM-type protein 1-like [Trifolium pratense]